MMKLRFTNTDEKRKKTIISLLINVIKYFLVIVAILMILNVYDINTSALVASLGAVGVVLGLALQDTLKDLVSGIFIIFENQYGIGDTVTIDNFKGEVIAIGLKTTKLKAYTGDIKTIPNRNIQSVINYSVEPSLAIVNVQISYEDDLNKSLEVLKNLCIKLTQELPYLKGEVTVLGVTDLGDSGIEIRLTVETESMKNYEIERLIKKAIKIELDQHQITIPYQQVVIHHA